MMRSVFGPRWCHMSSGETYLVIRAHPDSDAEDVFVHRCHFPTSHPNAKQKGRKAKDRPI